MSYELNVKRLELLRKEFEPAFAAVAKEGVDAIIVLPDALVMQHRARIIEFAMKQRTPVVSGWPAFARSGAVVTYGPNMREPSARAPARLTRFSREPIQQRFRSSSPPSSSWSSTSMRRERSASHYRHSCSPAPTR
jgi:hypothetical protein